MGINGLLPFLKSIQRPTHIKNWKGKIVAVDAYGWLHRGTISCAIDLALGKHTTKYVDYAMHRVRMLQHYGVTPYIVFDGDYLPGKKGTELDREKKRQSSRETGLELLKLGRTTQAHLELQKAIDVTPLMARHFIEELKKANVPYIVAPYEADAQMAYLESIGEVSAILSEDSDLLVFGAKCLLTKLGQYGDCIAINRSDFPKISDVNMVGWSDSEFRRMAILSGCDYLANIPKMGIKTAYRFVRKYRSAEKILKAIRMDGSFIMPANYEKAFLTAEMTFQYQRVYCPKACRLLSCNGTISLPETINVDQALNFGRLYDSGMASKVAFGDFDPITKLEIKLRAPAIVLPQARALEQRNASITRFFAPKRVLAELPTGNSKVTSRNTNSEFFCKPSPNRARKSSTTLESAFKKRRFCMDDEEESAAYTERSPFFTKKLQVSLNNISSNPGPATIKLQNQSSVANIKRDAIMSTKSPPTPYRRLMASSIRNSYKPDAKLAPKSTTQASPKPLTAKIAALDVFRFQVNAPQINWSIFVYHYRCYWIGVIDSEVCLIFDTTLWFAEDGNDKIYSEPSDD
ncbi:hypothetical protein H072_5871 [Dactylellina haptotyla CBS 200.50]|uniref:Uncharacterized protein n=1 Tax=Dactylellina haptotyla (strain CBS 200.50) TaxID=1284197 RepID=S8BY88_DACHA|nr:hypothetical protein H072_5871 [Dactylellina haptotyla CBS 200.50]